MSVTSVEREIWQEKAGGFYPLLVAAQAQTRLPLAGRLVPSEADLQRSLYLLPIVGLVVGLVWAGVSAMAFEFGLDPFMGAAVVASVMVASEGLCLERAIATRAARGLGAWRDSVGQESDGDDALLTKVGVVCISISLRVGALAAIAPSMRFEGLLAAAVLSRWSLSLAPLLQQVRSSARNVHTMLRSLLIAGLVVLVMALTQGASGVLLMGFCAMLMVLVTRGTSSSQDSLAASQGVALAALLLALLCQ